MQPANCRRILAEALTGEKKPLLFSIGVLYSPCVIFSKAFMPLKANRGMQGAFPTKRK
jgi:hypothetical protein|tara:strand:+ start:316 stop:489 length:174 start_codon:yes stop_codon:yes gene_type:complete